MDTDLFTSEILNFTYMNAGYVGYYVNCDPSDDASAYKAADETLTCTVFDITADSIEITRYDAEGRHALGGAGTYNPYKGGIDLGIIGDNHYTQKVDSPVTIERKSVGSGRDTDTDEMDEAA